MTIPPSPRRDPERAGSRPARDGSAGLSDEQLTGCVMSPLARCASGAIDPDEWFPVAKTATAARAEAARALALCAVCPVRAECLELSLRHWRTTGRYGIWGGLVEAERAAARGERFDQEFSAGSRLSQREAVTAARSRRGTQTS
jgi:WhiB family transcriptional regulator, redox-sensing transcriptional regulator